MSKRRIVVVGGGAGGLELATRLGRKRRDDLEVTLVDHKTSHFWKPLLHQVASGALDSHLDEINFLGQAARSGFTYAFGGMSGLDRERREIILAPVSDPDSGESVLPERRLPYDDLVLAVGAVSNDFGVPGVREHAFFLDGRDEAQNLRQRLLVRLVQCHDRRQRGEACESVKAVIVGGGATGVELAAELVQMEKALARHAPPGGERILSVTLLETAPRILAGASDEIAEGARCSLEALGVRVRTGCKVTEVAADHVAVEGAEPLGTGVTIWAAGVQGPPFLADLGLPAGNDRRLRVDARLRVEGEDAILALGDCSRCTDGDGKDVPARAQAASQQGDYLADRLALPAGERTDKPFVYRDRGTLVSIAGLTAYGKIGSGRSAFIHGRTAQVAYASLRRSHQMTLLGRVRTAALILSDWLRSPVRPPLKLV